MPLFMDVHTIDGGVAIDDVAKAHQADLDKQGDHDVSYLRYWVDEAAGQDLLPGRGAVRRRRLHRAPRGARPRGRRDLPRPGGVVKARVVAATLGAALALAVLPAASAGATDRALLAQVRQATVQFHDLQAALDAGYVQFLPCFDDGVASGMGQHFAMMSLIDGVADALHPEVLVYEPHNGRYQLVALEYVIPQSLWTGEEPPMLFGEHFHRTTPSASGPCTPGSGGGTRVGCTTTSARTSGCARRPADPVRGTASGTHGPGGRRS